MIYILKDGTKVESIPVGRSTVQIGAVSPDGYLTVYDRGPNIGSNTGASVICKCKCGNYTLIKWQAFRNGTTKSCGCYMRENNRKRMKILGKKPAIPKDYTKIDNPYYIFVKKLEEKDASNSFYWIVKCKKCGKEFKEVPAYIVSDKRRKGNNPCECWRKTSKGVLKIEEILKNNNIPFMKEYQFSDCISPKGNLLKFDFYINNSCLIEYDGEQHFLPEKFNSNQDGVIKLAQQKEYDNIKNIWCLKNNIPLIRIPYTHYSYIALEDLDPKTSKFLIKGGQNDEL